MMHRKKECEECHKLMPVKSGCVRAGHFLCWRDKRKTHFQILGKFNQPVKPAGFGITPKSSPVSLMSPEAKFLWVKHVKQTSNEKLASDSVHQVRFWTKYSHYNQRQNYKESARKNGIKFTYPTK